MTPEAPHMTWYLSELNAFGKTHYLLTLVPFTYIVLLDNEQANDVASVVVDAFDSILDYHDHMNVSFSLDADKVEWGVTQQQPDTGTQQRLKQIQQQARNLKDTESLLDYIERLNVEIPMLINGRKITPMDALGELLAEVERDYEEYLESTGFIKTLWHSMRGKRPWLERKG